MIQRAFVDFCRVFEFPPDQSDWEAAFLTVDKGKALSFDNLAMQGIRAMTPRAFVEFCCVFKFSPDRDQRETAFFTVDERGTLSIFHLAPFGIQTVGFFIFRFARCLWSVK